MNHRKSFLNDNDDLLVTSRAFSGLDDLDKYQKTALSEIAFKDPQDGRAKAAVGGLRFRSQGNYKEKPGSLAKQFKKTGKRSGQ